MFARHSVLLCLTLWTGLTAFGAPASAQMVLPGAVAPTPEGAAVTPEAQPARPKRSKVSPEGPPAPVVMAVAPAAKVPMPASLVGQTLWLNGRKSQAAFDLRDKALVVSRLVLGGERMSVAQEACEVEAAVTPIATKDLGQPDGLYRVRMDFPACPIAIDILDGAVLAVGDPPACEFKEADCRILPNGLWGPQPGAIGPDQVKSIDHARALAEAQVRTDYKLLVATTKDRPTIMGYARDQAGFSSAREEICRDYLGEGRHGFCATRLTEARAAGLRARYVIEAALKAERLAKKAARKRR